MSTIKTMESFGDIGNDVLLEHGLIKINKDDDYPYELRHESHKTILDRVGEISLTAFGFNYAESFQPLVLKETQQEYLNNMRYLNGEVFSKNDAALKNILFCLAASIDKNIRISSQKVGYEYGASLDLIEKIHFQSSMSTASVVYQKFFLSDCFSFI